MDLSNAWIKGEMLRHSLRLTKANSRFGSFEINDRIKLDMTRDLYALGIELSHPIPFVIEENFFITAHDLDSPSMTLECDEIRFTSNALKSAVFWKEAFPRLGVDRACPPVSDDDVERLLLVCKLDCRLDNAAAGLAFMKSQIA